MSKRKGDFDNNKLFRKKISYDSADDSTDSETLSKNNSDLKNIKLQFNHSNSENYVPSSLNIGLGKLNLGAINKKNNNYYDDGYETDDTVLEEDYVPQADWVPPKSGYKMYLEDRKKKLDSYDPGYETDDTVILDDDGNYKLGGRRIRLFNKKSHKRHGLYKRKTFKRIIKKSYKKKHRKSNRRKTRKYRR